MLLGPPGAGKGTQGALLAERAGLWHVSTGDLFRQAVAAETPAGQRAEQYLTSGELVPDELVNELVEEFIAANADASLCLDGFPRTRRQAVALDAFMTELNRSVTAALLISVSDSVALSRLTGRGRGDDSLGTARNRLQVYHRHTDSLIDYYRRRRLLVEVDGAGDMDDVADRIWSAYSQIT